MAATLDAAATAASIALEVAKELDIKTTETTDKKEADLIKKEPAPPSPGDAGDAGEGSGGVGANRESIAGSSPGDSPGTKLLKGMKGEKAHPAFWDWRQHKHRMKVGDLDPPMMIVSKKISYILRHGARFLDIDHDEEGWLKASDLLQTMVEKYEPNTLEKLMTFLHESNEEKPRYEIRGEDSGKIEIRANRGRNSVKVNDENLSTPTSPNMADNMQSPVVTKPAKATPAAATKSSPNKSSSNKNKNVVDSASKASPMSSGAGTSVPLSSPSDGPASGGSARSRKTDPKSASSAGGKTPLPGEGKNSTGRKVQQGAGGQQGGGGGGNNGNNGGKNQTGGGSATKNSEGNAPTVGSSGKKKKNGKGEKGGEKGGASGDGQQDQQHQGQKGGNTSSGLTAPPGLSPPAKNNKNQNKSQQPKEKIVFSANIRVRNV